MLPQAAAHLKDIMAVSSSPQPSDVEASAALAAKAVMVGLGLYKAIDAALLNTPAGSGASSCR